MKERYRFYRDHKFIIAFVNDTGRMIAKTNFCDHKQVQKLKERVDGLVTLLKGHAEYEDNIFHPLLDAKGSNVHETIAADHKNNDAVFATWEKALKEIYELEDTDEKKQRGYEFYLAFREFEANTLIHLNNEENLIMPELQRFYSDDELKAVEANIYRKDEMTPDAMVRMMSTLFPYMDENDHLVFLNGIRDATPDKFAEVFRGVAKAVTDENKPILEDSEVKQLMTHFSLIEEA